MRLVWNLALVTPATALLAICLIAPIVLFLWRSVANPEIPTILPQTVAALRAWNGAGMPDDAAYAGLRRDIAEANRADTLGVLAQRLNFIAPGYRSLLNKTANLLDETPRADARAELIGIDRRWDQPDIWVALKQQSGGLTDFYYLTALDLRHDATGAIARVPADERLFISLFGRTLITSLSVTLLCLLLGYPAAHLLASAGPRGLPFLMVLVLLPFWTPILVRTTAWVVLLQDQGLINRLLRGAGLIDGSLPLFGNRFAVMLSMTQQLLPYMVLPLYAAMRKVPPELVRAASSLGANPWRAFRRVYLPQTIPGMAAGVLIVLILALGYYVTPLLVGGPADQMISYFIAAYTNEYLNWGLASALGTLLLMLAGAIYLMVGRLGGTIRLGAP
jgi:putative spermidine/putrescine transport system permease protein